MALIDKIQESGWADTTADDWFFKDDVKSAVDSLKEKIRSMALCGASSRFLTGKEVLAEIEAAFGDLDKSYDDIVEAEEAKGNESE
jgi:hypothetical protein